jgi:hypothetical protein
MIGNVKIYMKGSDGEKKLLENSGSLSNWDTLAASVPHVLNNLDEWGAVEFIVEADLHCKKPVGSRFFNCLDDVNESEGGVITVKVNGITIGHIQKALLMESSSVFKELVNMFNSKKVRL